MCCKLLTRIHILFVLIVFSVQGFATPDLFTSETTVQAVIKAPLNKDKNALITITEQAETTPEQIRNILQSQAAEQADILVSSDNEKVIESAILATSSKQDKRLLRIIPIGKLASTKQKIASGFSEYYNRAKNTVMHDRIGLTVLTITVGYDTLIWIHSASLDIHQKSAMVMMNLVMAATFGLDRDLWTKMTSPLKHRLIRVFDRFISNENLAKINVLSSQFLSNLLFGIGVQVVRTGLLSLDNISTAVITTEFWLTAMKIGGLVTATTFAWTEMFGAIDPEKQPVAKMMMKRIGELRGIVLCHLASISMVLQPHVYGNTPVISFIVHGSLGLLVILNADRIVEFIENNHFINKIYKKVQTFENYINNSLQFGSSRRAVISCRSLFSY